MMALAFSGGKDSMACLHLMKDQLECAIYVDTGFSYPETRAMLAYAQTLLPVFIVYSDRAGQNEAHGIPADVVPIDWTTMGQAFTGPKPEFADTFDTDPGYLQCCWENISAPLTTKAKLMGVTQLVSGQRRDEGHTNTSRHGDVVDGITRLYPIQDWTEAGVFDFLRTHMVLPAHYGIRHSSLDCYDCPAYAKESEDRVQWTRHAHPELYPFYVERSAAVLKAIQEAV